MKKSIYFLFAALALTMACTTPEETKEDPTLSVDPKSLVIESAGGSKSVTVTANNAWEATITSGNDWITIEKAANSLNVSVPASPLHQSRMGSIIVTSGALSETISVTQLGSPNNDKIEVSPTSLSYDSAGGDKTVTVTANVTVSAVSSESWLTVKAPASASSPMTYTLTAAANTGSAARNATVTFSGGDAAAVTVQVSQTPASFIIADKNEINAEAAGGEFDVVITSNVEWTAATSESWVNLSPAAGTNATIKITVAANETTVERSATVTLSKDNISAVISVKQAGASSSQPTEETLLATWRCDSAEYTEAHSPDWSTTGANDYSHGTGKGIALPEDGAPEGTQMTWLRESGISFDLVYITAAEGHYAVKAVAAGDGYLFTIPGQNLKKDQVIKMDCGLASGANSSPVNWVIKFRLSETADWVIGESSTTTTTSSGTTAHWVCTKTKVYDSTSRFNATYKVPEDVTGATIQVFLCAADGQTIKGSTASGSTMRLIPLTAIEGVDTGFPGPRISILK